MFCLSGQKGRDAMNTDCEIGGGTSVSRYRHPLLSRISLFLTRLEGMPDPSATRRVRWTPMASAMAAVLMTLDRGCPLNMRFEDARACLAGDFVRSRRVGRTYNGLVKALERQSGSVLPVLKRDLRRQAKERLSRLRKTMKWLLLAVDGSKEDLPRTKDQEKVFGIADNGMVPQALMTTIVEVRTGLPWDWRIDRGRGSEKDHLVQMASDLPANALLLGDGNFVGFPIWSRLHGDGKDFLIRVGGNVHLITRLWPDAETRYERDIVYAWPKGRQSESPPLMLRLIKVGRGRKAVYLLTNVLDSKRLSQCDAGAIYRLRWGVELFFRTLKRTLGYAKLQSRAGRRARIELEWALITMMITTMMGIDAASQRRIDPGRLSPAHLIRTLRTFLLRDAGQNLSKGRAALPRALASSLKDNYRRRKPKRSRYRPQTKNTPKPLVLKPPQIRRATTKEQELARQYQRQTAA
jgi:hypothetical protein